MLKSSISPSLAIARLWLNSDSINSFYLIGLVAIENISATEDVLSEKADGRCGRKQLPNSGFHTVMVIVR